METSYGLLDDDDDDDDDDDNNNNNNNGTWHVIFVNGLVPMNES